MNMHTINMQSQIDLATVILGLQTLAEQPTCAARTLIVSARNQLGSVLFSAQYVEHPQSATGVYLQLHFKPDTQIDSVLIGVPKEWIHWQS